MLEYFLNHEYFLIGEITVSHEDNISFPENRTTRHITTKAEGVISLDIRRAHHSKRCLYIYLPSPGAATLTSPFSDQ